MKKPYDRAAFRAELHKRMPGFNWTVKNPLAHVLAVHHHGGGW